MYMKTKIHSILVVITLLFSGLLPQVHAVSPTPDGCYPNFTTAEGCDALSLLTTGAGNTGLGWRSLFSDTAGSFNTGVGAGAPGSFNTAVGASALFNSTGGDNTAVGAGALNANTTGSENLAIGVSALVSNETGERNIALGSFVGNGLTTGSDNILIGFNLGAQPDQSNTCYIKSIFGQTNNLGTTVFIDANHKLGTLTSSKRFKEDIKPMDNASDVLFALKPVTFHYKKEIDPVGTSQLGLVAEEVEKVNPDLVVRDKEGKPYSVRYDQVNAMLLNEFLKEHGRLEEQQRTIAELKSTVAQQQKSFQSKLSEQEKQIADLASGLAKVSAQIESTRPDPQVVVNNP
jgi:hypothetical protein